MKIIVLIFSMLILSNYSNAQWYKRKYNVYDINKLTSEQLNESLWDSKTNLGMSGVAVGLGAVVFVISKYNLWTTNDEPSLFEQLIGEKGMNDIYAGAGIAIMAGGLIAFLSNVERIKNIKMAIHRNFPPVGHIRFTPKIDYNRYTASGNLGLSITYKF